MISSIVCLLVLGETTRRETCTAFLFFYDKGSQIFAKYLTGSLKINFEEDSHFFQIYGPLCLS